jgi:hypothetical protein
MIFAKIEPAANIIIQEDAFRYTIDSPNYISAAATVYTIGGGETEFQIFFGYLIYPVEGEPAPKPFKSVYCQVLTLSAAELSDWGTDDTFVLQAIANKMQVNIVEFIDRPDITRP